MGKTVRIEPATSLFIISHPVCDAIVRKKTKNVTQQMLLEFSPSKLVFPPHSGVRVPHCTGSSRGNSVFVPGLSQL